MTYESSGISVTRITRNKFGFCKLLPEIPERNSGFGYFGFGFGYSGFGFRVTGFLPSPSDSALDYSVAARFRVHDMLLCTTMGDSVSQCGQHNEQENT
jgi:hypothetical protein